MDGRMITRTLGIVAAAATLWAGSADAQTGIPVTDARGGGQAQTPPGAGGPALPPGTSQFRPHPGFRPGEALRLPPGWRGYHGPITIVNDLVSDEVVAYPFQFRLPNPANGLIWIRSNNDAVLFDTVGRTIVEVRSRWFG